jgi:hypothetical protein
LDILIVLSLFGAYAVGAMFLSAIGANVYRDTAATMDENYGMRTGALYIAEKLRQNDVADGVRLDGIEGGGDALVLIENRTGEGYETWIYVYDGALREILTARGAAIPLESGQIIMPMEAMELERASGDLLRVSLTSAGGGVSNLSLSLRAVKEGTG